LNILEKTAKKTESISSKQKAQKNSLSKLLKLSSKKLKHLHMPTLRNKKIHETLYFASANPRQWKINTQQINTKQQSIKIFVEKNRLRPDQKGLYGDEGQS